MSVWDGLTGQDEAVAALRFAAEGPEGTGGMTHSWLITGPPGSGRSVAARAFAAALQCTGEVPGCGRCKPCRDVLAGSHPDVVRLATDKLLITMDEVKELIGGVSHGGAHDNDVVALLFRRHNALRDGADSLCAFEGGSPVFLYD